MERLVMAGRVDRAFVRGNDDFIEAKLDDGLWGGLHLRSRSGNLGSVGKWSAAPLSIGPMPSRFLVLGSDRVPAVAAATPVVLRPAFVSRPHERHAWLNPVSTSSA